MEQGMAGAMERKRNDICVNLMILAVAGDWNWKP